MPLQEQWWNFCTIRIKANENSLEVVDEALADEFFCWVSKSALCLYIARTLRLQFFRTLKERKSNNAFPFKKVFRSYDKFQPIPMKHRLTEPIDLPRFCSHQSWQEACGKLEVVGSSCLIQGIQCFLQGDESYRILCPFAGPLTGWQ